MKNILCKEVWEYTLTDSGISIVLGKKKNGIDTRSKVNDPIKTPSHQAPTHLGSLVEISIVADGWIIELNVKWFH